MQAARLQSVTRRPEAWVHLHVSLKLISRMATNRMEEKARSAGNPKDTVVLSLTMRAATRPSHGAMAGN